MRWARAARSWELGRWIASACVVVAAHAAVAYALVSAPEDAQDQVTAGAFVLELAPLAVARADVPPEVAPGPDQVQSEATPPKPQKVETVDEQPPLPELPVTLPAAVALPRPEPKPEPPQEETPPPQVAVAATTASQVVSEQKAPIAAAPIIGAPRAIDAHAVSNWQTRVATALERNKRYPGAARSRGDQGTAFVTFTIDRQGRLVASRLARSSGSALLDEEAQALLRRAQPFAVPPSELPGAEVTVSVPIRFNLR